MTHVPNVARNTIQWDEEPKCAKAKVSPELEHQNTCKKLTSIFSHKHIKRLIAVRKKLK
jgi:hypothetical protein